MIEIHFYYASIFVAAAGGFGLGAIFAAVIFEANRKDESE
jgi:hypothetical protein